MAKIFKGVPYSGTLPAVISDTKAGYLHRYKAWGNVGENLLEIEPEMLNEANWTLSPAGTITYFMYYQLGAATAERLKEIGTIAGTVYLVAGGTYYNGEVLAITSEMKSNNVTTKERLLQNNGTPLQYTADVSEYNDIYLCIGYGSGITLSNKQTLINSLFDNFDIMLTAGSTVPSTYIPYKECGERTENLFPGSPTISGKSTAVQSTFNTLAAEINFESGKQYALRIRTNTTSSAGVFRITFTYSDDTTTKSRYIARDTTDVVLTSSAAKTVTSLTITNYNAYADITLSEITVVEDSTAPSTYIPYGYKLPLQSDSTPVDIYIGDDTLSDSEYVDSGTGKIYRMVSGVLMPVDPPVPFPSIPTSANSTTVSYAGEGLAPSKFDSIAEWVNATPKIYHNGAWVDAQTYTYTGGEWVADN